MIQNVVNAIIGFESSSILLKSLISHSCFLRTMQKKIIALVLTVLVAIGLVVGLFAFYNYMLVSPRNTYQLSLGNVAGGSFLNGVQSYITPRHGNVTQIQIFVISQRGDNSSMVLSDTFTATSLKYTDCTNPTYTLGETVVIHRNYQDGYAETTNGILLTQQMRIGMIPALGERGPPPPSRLLEIPIQQWFPLAVSG
jgi:hypothetical protein